MHESHIKQKQRREGGGGEAVAGVTVRREKSKNNAAFLRALRLGRESSVCARAGGYAGGYTLYRPGSESRGKPAGVGLSPMKLSDPVVL